MDENAYAKYQGHEYQRILIEELTQIPREKNYLSILASARSTIPGLRPRIFATTNPGGIGHLWVKERFIDVAEWGKPFVEEMILPDGRALRRARVFIHATMDDNPTLMKNDPSYVMNIEALKESDPERYKAWRYGDWDVFEGQVFGEFKRDKHVIDPITPNKSFSHFLGMDWGYSKNSAFAAYLGALIPSKTEDGDPFNRVIIYKEFYGNQKSPDDWAEEIYKYCVANNIKPKKGFVDPAMLNSRADSSVSIGKIMENKWVELYGRHFFKLHKGSNNRIQGVATIHNWLSMGPDGLPYVLFTKNCLNMIKTLPMLPYDEHNIEDVDCFVAGTKVDTLDGLKNIEDVTIKDYCLTPIGYRKVIKDGISGKAKTIRIKLSNGKVLQGTLDHKIFVQGKGLVELQNLKKYDILTEKINLCHVKQFLTKVLNIVGTKVEDIMNQMEHIYQKDTLHFIGKFTLITLEKFLKIIVSIIKIIIMMTTVQKTLKWLVLQSMLNIIFIIEKLFKKDSKFGGQVRKARRYLERMLKKCMNEHQKGGSRASVVKRLLQQNTHNKFIVQNNVVKNVAMGKLKKIVQFVVSHFGLKESLKKKLKPVHIVAVGSSEEKIVYNLTVEDAHLYYANGILVTNTDSDDHAFDSLKYILSKIKFISVKPGAIGGNRSIVVRPPAFAPDGKQFSINPDIFNEENFNNSSRSWKSL